MRISTATRKGITNIKLLDRYGKARLALIITEDDEAAIGLRDRTGKYTWVKEAE